MDRLPNFIRAFHSRNFQLFFFGQVISLIGTWMTQTASLWLAYGLTHSAGYLGAVGFSSQIPIFFIAPFAGVWIDRVQNRKNLLIATQVLALLQSLALAVLAFDKRLNIWGLIFLSVAQGIINGVDLPCRQAFLIELVKCREDLTNAIALNSSMFNGARLIGPALGGMAIAAFGVAGCYFIDAVSYIPVVGSLFFIKPYKRNAHKPLCPKDLQLKKTPLHDIKVGWKYVLHHAPIKALITNVAIMSFVGFSATVLMPIFARDIFEGNAQVLGWLLSATGVGALTGAIYLSTRSQVKGIGRVIVIGCVLVATGLIGCGLSPNLWMCLAAMALVGLGGVLSVASSNMALQSIVEDNKRGRVMSFYSMAFLGMAPLGNLVVGFLVKVALNVREMMVICGCACLIAAFMFNRKRAQLRRAVAKAPPKAKITSELSSDPQMGGANLRQN